MTFVKRLWKGASGGAGSAERAERGRLVRTASRHSKRSDFFLVPAAAGEAPRDQPEEPPPLRDGEALMEPALGTRPRPPAVARGAR